MQRRQIGQHPRKPGQQEDAHGPGQNPAPVGQGAKEAHGQRQGGQPDQGQHQQPGEGRQAVGQAVAVEDQPPGSALLLQAPLLFAEHQGVLPLLRLLLLSLLPPPAGHVAGVEPVGDVFPINPFAEQRLDLFPVIVGGLAVDEHFGVVIDGELLLGPGIVELEAKETGVGVKLGDLFKAQLPGEQQLIVAGRHRVAHRQAGDRLPQPPAAHADIIGFVQRVQQLFQFFGRVLVIEGQLQAAIGSRAKSDAPVHVERQRIVKVLVGDGRSQADQRRAAHRPALKVVGLAARQGGIGQVNDVTPPSLAAKGGRDPALGQRLAAFGRDLDLELALARPIQAGQVVHHHGGSRHIFRWDKGRGLPLAVGGVHVTRRQGDLQLTGLPAGGAGLQRRPRLDVLVHPAAGLHPRHRPGVDLDEGKGPTQRPQQHDGGQSPGGDLPPAAPRFGPIPGGDHQVGGEHGQVRENRQKVAHRLDILHSLPEESEQDPGERDKA